MTKNQPIPASDALPCIQAYAALMSPNANPNAIAQAYTTYTGFHPNELKAWLEENAVLDNSTTIRFYSGVYTENFVNKYGLPKDRIGKISIFIWADYNRNVNPSDGPRTEDYFFNNGNTNP